MTLGRRLISFGAAAGTPADVHWLVQAGGGGGGNSRDSGGSAGGLRTSYGSNSGAGSSASSESQLTFSAGTTYTITVGAGGTAAITASEIHFPYNYRGTDGTASSISGPDITDITTEPGRGGKNGGYSSNYTNVSGATIDGGAGCGEAYARSASNGTGSFVGPYKGDGTNQANGDSTDQGYDGGNAHAPYYAPGGAGGTGAVGGNAGSYATWTTFRYSGSGGVGTIVSIINDTQATANSVGEVDSGNVYFGGGGGSSNGPGNYTVSSGGGGLGGGGNAGAAVTYHPTYAENGHANSGGGGGASAMENNYVGTGGNGGSGCVILRMATDAYSGTTTGSPTVITDGSDTILIYKSSGTYTQ